MELTFGPLDEFRGAYLPYCIDRQPDGRYVVLNRMYKPLGFRTRDWVDYENYPISIKLRGLGPAVAAKISARGDSSLDRIYLYHDGCIPTASPKDWEAYQKRLAILAKLTAMKT